MDACGELVVVLEEKAVGPGRSVRKTVADRLRNISGQVNGDGTVTIYAATSTVSGSGDQGADPNEVSRSPTSSTRPRRATSSSQQSQAHATASHTGVVAVVPDNYES